MARWWWVVGLLAGCAKASSGPTTSPPAAEPTPATSASAPVAECVLPPLGDTLPVELDSARRDAVDALLMGHLRRASAGFQWVAAERPGDRVTEALWTILESEIERAGAGLASWRVGASVEVIHELPTSYVLHKPIPLPPSMTSQEAPTLRVSITSPVDLYSSRHGHPRGIAQGWGRWAPRAWLHPDHLIYGDGPSALQAAKHDKAALTFIDFSNPVNKGGIESQYGGPLRSIHGAQVVGKTLLASLGWKAADPTNPPLSSSGEVLPPSGFLTAVDLESGKIYWWSEPDTAGPFAVSGAYIIAGITSANREKGALSVVELATGKTVSRVEIPFPPSSLERVGDRIVALDGRAVRAWVSLSTGIAPVLPAELSGDSLQIQPEERCRALRAMAALDRQDDVEALAILDAQFTPRSPLILGLRAAAEGIAADRLHPEEIPLKSRIPVYVHVPDRAVFREITPDRAAPNARLVRIRDVYFHYDGDGRHEITVEDPGVTFPVPGTLFKKRLTRTVGAGTRSILIYGNLFVVVLEGREVLNIFDLDALGSSDTREPMVRGALHGDTLIMGSSDYLVAIDVRTGALRWRSEDGVSSINFVLLDDLLVSASFAGIKGGKPHIYLLDPASGKTLQKEVVADSPYGVVLNKDGSLSVVSEVARNNFKIVRKATKK